jgi:hypothetical protein
MITVNVMNTWDKDFVTEYGCEDLKFPVGKSVEVPIVVARHIFGYEDSDKEKYMARHGWITTTNDIPNGLKILEKFRISPVMPKENHALSPVVEQVPFPPKRGGGKVLSMSA